MKLNILFSVCLLFSLFFKNAYANKSNTDAIINKVQEAIDKHDYSFAFKEAKKASDANDPRGDYALGLLFQKGWGVTADDKQAFQWFQKAAKKGWSSGMEKVAWAFYEGKGVAQDKNKALAIARFLATDSRNAYGRYLVYLFLTGGEELSVLDANNQIDEKKREQLSNRPVSERSLDIEAYDSLYQAAATGNANAKVALAFFLAEYVGVDNRKKMLALLKDNQGINNSELKEYEVIAEHMGKLGESYVPVKFFPGIQASMQKFSETKGCTNNQSNSQPPTPNLSTQISMRITQPISDAIYLPSKVEGYEKSYVVAGEWQEEWQYEACGKTITVPLHFTATGLGGLANINPEPQQGFALVGRSSVSVVRIQKQTDCIKPGDRRYDDHGGRKKILCPDW